MRLHALLVLYNGDCPWRNPVKFQIDPNYVYLYYIIRYIITKEMKIYKTL